MPRTTKPSKANTKSEAKSGGGSNARGLTYADAGVHLETYDRFISSIGRHVRRTHTQRVMPNPGGFAGLFRLDYNEHLFQRNYKDPVLVACTDGVGTKVKLAAQMGRYDTVGIDLVAMSVNDLIVQGAEPLFFLDYIAVPVADQEILEPMVAGVSEGCLQSGCALLGGETAEMPGVYAPGEFDMAGFAVGVVELKRATDSLRVAPGDEILGLGSSGVHSNGYSLVRKIVETCGADLGDVDAELDPERTIGDVLLEPTRIYAESIVKVQRRYRVKKVISAMALITGGGLVQNLERSLPEGVDAVIRRKALPTDRVFEWLAEKGRVDAEEMARVFNMGVGYVAVVRPTFADSIADQLQRSGERVFRLGRITKGSGRVRLK